MTDLLLDTCAMIFMSMGETMRRAARDALEAAMNRGGDLMVSPCSAWEIGMKAARGKFTLSQRPEVWFSAFMDRGGVSLAPLTPSILIASSFLPEGLPKDPADRIIAATAREYGYSVVTRDRALLDYADAGHINAIEC